MNAHRTMDVAVSKDGGELIPARGVRFGRPTGGIGGTAKHDASGSPLHPCGDNERQWERLKITRSCGRRLGDRRGELRRRARRKRFSGPTRASHSRGHVHRRVYPKSFAEKKRSRSNTSSRYPPRPSVLWLEKGSFHALNIRRC